MNTKKNKKHVNNVDVEEDGSNVVPKKTKKKKLEITNENANTENKSKKRKLVAVEEETVPLKKLKKKLKSITALENNTELLSTEDSTNGITTTKNLKPKTSLNFDEIPQEETKTTKKGKKKKKIEDNSDMNNETVPVDTDPGEGVSYTKHVDNSKTSKDDVIEDTEEKVSNSAKQILHQEVNIIDIKTQNVNEDNENVVTISIRDVAGMDSDWDENDLLKQLERRVEKKEISKEKRVGLDWPEVDLMELVERMEVAIPENDLKPFMKRTDELEWDKIAFKNYSIEDCKKTWLYVLKKIRKYRILREVLEDAKKWVTTAKIPKKSAKTQRHPDMPRRPLSAYFIFYLKEKDNLQAEHPGTDATELAKFCAQKFKQLSAEKLQKYEKLAKKNKEEYDQKLKTFYELHPEFRVTKESKPKKIKSPKPVKEKSPPKPPKLPKEKIPKRPLSAFQYFHNAELSKNPTEDQDKSSLREINREKWKEMPDDKKMEWITYAEAETVRYEEEMREYMKNHPDYVNNEKKPQLTKEDILVKERMSGKPPKPPVSAYNHFARLMLHSEDIKEVPVKSRLMFVSNQWKECTEEEKKHYKELFDKEIEKYNQEFAAYLETLPEADRKLELMKAHPKRRKSEDEKSKKESKSKKLTKKKTELKPEKKKVNKVSEKKLEKAKEKPRKLVEPEQPPISPCKYFATLYKGEEPPLKAWKALSAEEKKKYEEELTLKKKAYILDFEKFLKSMTKEELENFSISRKKINSQKSEEAEEEEEEEEDDDEETSDSDDNSESGDSGEENN